MVIVPSLLLFVTLLFCDMPGMWKACHRFGLGWLIGRQALLPGWRTWAALARWAPPRSWPDISVACSRLPTEMSICS